MDVKKPVQKVVVWAKANPVMAGLLLIGVIALGYLASQQKGKMSAVSGSLVDDAAGAGIMGGGEEKPPLIPYIDYDPPAGFPPPPIPPLNGGNGEYIGDPIYSWTEEIFEPVVEIYENISDNIDDVINPKTDPWYADEWEMPHRQPLDTSETYYTSQEPVEGVLGPLTEAQASKVEAAPIGTYEQVAAYYTQPSEPTVHRQIETETYYAPQEEQESVAPTSMNIAETFAPAPSEPVVHRQISTPTYYAPKPPEPTYEPGRRRR